MSNKFVPFKKFDGGIHKKAKSLHDTMQDNPNEKFDRKEECRPNCVPYWQETGELRCNNNIVEAEEADGCGNTRWKRVELIEWVSTDEEEGCDEEKNRILVQQTNQCGDLRWVTTERLCCTPDWVRTDPVEYNCDQTSLRVLEEDGCGNTRLTNTSQSVTWTPTGEDECLPGNIYRIEEINQCGETRMREIAGGCPCIPDWQVGPNQRCTGTYLENQEEDGCGRTRWVTTTDPVTWTPTGQSRCNGAYFVELEEINQCGDKRWVQTATTCEPPPPCTPTEPILPSFIGAALGCCPRPQDAIDNHMFFNIGSNGMANAGSSCFMSPGPESWVPEGFTADDYEFMYEHIDGQIQGADGFWFSGADGFSATLDVPTGPASAKSQFNLYWRVAGDTGNGFLWGTFTMNVAVGEECNL